MTILVTRPELGASRTMTALAARGLDVLSCPLFSIVPSEAARPNGKFAALLVTSGHGASGLTPAAADLPANLPVFAVGDRTAEAMMANGFSNVTSASGDQKALTRLVLAKLSPRYRVLLATGEDHKDGLPAAFAEAGHEIAIWIRYRAEPLSELPDVARSALAAGSIDKVLHYSRRASETFVMLADKAGVGASTSLLHHVALSEDVAEPLRAAGCDQIAVASHPDEEHMLALVTGGEVSVVEGSAAAPAARTEQATPEVMRTTPRTRKSVSSPVLTQPIAAADTNDNPRATGETAKTVASDMPVADKAEPFSAQPVQQADQPAEKPKETPTFPAAHGPESLPPVVQKRVAGLGAIVAVALTSGLIGAGAIGLMMPLFGQMGTALPQPPEVSALNTRLAKLEAAGAASAAPDLQATVRSAVQNALQAADAPVAPRLSEQLSSLDRRISELATRPQAGGSSAADSAAQAAALAELRGKVTQAEAAAQAITPRLVEVEKIVRAVGAPSTSATGAAKLIVADRLSRALGEGRPFVMELNALSALGAAAEPVRSLGALASSGAPSLDAITTEFRKLRPIFAAEPASPDAAWSERLLKLTDGLVRVRSTGAVQGSSPAAVATRIDQALQRGDSAAAAAAFADLPEPARRAGEAWISRLRLRASADQAIKTITDDAIKALSAQK